MLACLFVWVGCLLLLVVVPLQLLGYCIQFSSCKCDVVYIRVNVYCWLKSYLNGYLETRSNWFFYINFFACKFLFYSFITDNFPRFFLLINNFFRFVSGSNFFFSVFCLLLLIFFCNIQFDFLLSDVYKSTFLAVLFCVWLFSAFVYSFDQVSRSNNKFVIWRESESEKKN